MNTRQKIGLGIIAPLFAFAVGHTVVNKINMNNEKTKMEVLPDISNALEMQDKNAVAVFRAEQNILNSVKCGQATQKDLKERINVFEQNQTHEFEQIMKELKATEKKQ